MSADVGGPYALDAGNLLDEWLADNPSADAQAPVVEFLASLCRDGLNREDGAESIWSPTPEGFVEVRIVWVIDHHLRLVRLARVGSRVRGRAT
jgi:hypothetical protein